MPTTQRNAHTMNTAPAPAAPNLRAIGPNAAHIARRLATMPGNLGSGAPRLSPEEISALINPVDITRAARLINASREAVAHIIKCSSERRALRFIGTYCYGMAAADLSATENQVKASNYNLRDWAKRIDRETARAERRADVARRLRAAPYHDRQILANVARRSGMIPVQMMADLVEFLAVD